MSHWTKSQHEHQRAMAIHHCVIHSVLLLQKMYLVWDRNGNDLVITDVCEGNGNTNIIFSHFLHACSLRCLTVDDDDNNDLNDSGLINHCYSQTPTADMCSQLK